MIELLIILILLLTSFTAWGILVMLKVLREIKKAESHLEEKDV
jgi:hypothetical protein